MPAAPLRRALAALAPDSDAALLGRFAADRSEPAFAALVRRHGPLVLGVCRRVVPDAHLADDAFQAAFVVLARRAASLDATRPLGPWLYAVAHRVALRARAMLGKRRKRETLTPTVPDAPHPPPSPDDATAVLDEEIANLPPAARDAVVLCELQGHARKDAAAKLGIPEGTLSSRLAAARKALAVRLRARGVVPAVAGATAVSPELAAAAVRAGVGGAVPPVVASLSNGASATTLLNKLAAAAVLFTLMVGVGVGPWKPGETAAAPVPKAKGDAGLIWVFSPAKGELTAYTPDGKAARAVTLAAGGMDPVTFFGVTPDGRHALVAAKKGVPPADRQAGYDALHAGELTVHLWPLSGGGKAADTGIGCQYWSRYVTGRDGTTLVVDHDRSPRDEKGVPAFPIRYETVAYDLTTFKGAKRPALPDGFTLVADLANGDRLLNRSVPNGGPRSSFHLLAAGSDKPTAVTGDDETDFCEPTADGRKVLVTRQHSAKTKPGDSFHRMAVIDLAGGKAEAFAPHPNTAYARGFWSPDGRRVVYEWLEEGATPPPQDFGRLRATPISRGQVVVCGADGGGGTVVLELEGTASDDLARAQRWHEDRPRLLGWFPTAPAADPKANPPEKLDRVPDAPPELRKELAGWDTTYRHGTAEKFAELEARADELAKGCDTDHDRARVWFAVAHIAAQSDIRKHTGRVREYAARCLKISRDPLDRGHLYGYLASVEEAADGEFAARRRKAAGWLLTGYAELLAQNLPDARPELPGVGKFRIAGDGPELQQARAKNAAQVAAREQAEWVGEQVARRDTLVLQLRNLYEPHPKIHGRTADGPNELRTLAGAKLPTTGDVDTLLARVLPGGKADDREPVKAPAPKARENDMGLTAKVGPGKTEIMLGEPTFFEFTVENPTERSWGFDVGGDYRNRLGRPESFAVTVTGPDGKAVPQPDAGPSMGGLSTGVKLPAGGKHSFALFLPHWATFDQPGEYTITVQRKFTLVPLDPAEREGAKPTPAVVSAAGKITVVATDAKRMGTLIDGLAKAMLDRNSGESERATKMMLEIADERVVPHFADLGKLPHPSPRSAACDGLKRFKTDAAFVALKGLAATTGPDLRGSATTAELEASSADGVRHAAVGALAACGHPDAAAEVWKAAADPYFGVRMTVLHAAYEAKSADARAVIATLTADANEAVRTEAKRYAALLAKQR